MADDTLLTRTVPHNMEAEKAVIGSIILDNSTAEAACEVLTGDDFYNKGYGLIFDCISDLFAARKPMDLVTLSDKLREKGAPEEMQSAGYLKTILDSVPTSANIRSYVNIVYEKSTLRRLIKVSEEISKECYDEKESLESILELTEKNVFDVVKARNTKEYEPINQIVVRALARIEEVSRIKGNVTGLSTGFKDLDGYTAGFQNSDFILVAARPSMGKTAFALSIVDDVVIKQKKSAAIFSLEMSRESLVNRLLAMEARIDAQNIRSGDLSEQEWKDLAESSEVIAASKLIIDDTPGITIQNLRSKCRKYKMEEDIQLVVIDYIQLMTSGGRSDNRQQEISDISRAIKGIARELDIPILVLSQLSRAVDQRNGDHRPVLSDIRESGAIEQDADVILFLYREDYYNPETERKNVTDVLIAKQRNGPVGTISLTWQPKYTRFVNTAKPV